MPQSPSQKLWPEVMTRLQGDTGAGRKLPSDFTLLLGHRPDRSSSHSAGTAMPSPG